MFKVGDRVKRIEEHQDTWWEYACNKFNLDFSGVFTVAACVHDTIIFEEFLDREYNFDPDYFELAEQHKEPTKMISLKDNKTALINLSVTIEAIEKFDILIEHYSEDKPGPAYIQMKHVPHTNVDVQIDRQLMVVALVAQRQKLIDYMATLGIDANN